MGLRFGLPIVRLPAISHSLFGMMGGLRRHASARPRPMME